MVSVVFMDRLRLVLMKTDSHRSHVNCLNGLVIARSCGQRPQQRLARFTRHFAHDTRYQIAGQRRPQFNFDDAGTGFIHIEMRGAIHRIGEVEIIGQHAAVVQASRKCD